MQCPFCKCKESKVIDSRHIDSISIKRRRECEDCKKRFTTYEKIETVPLMTIKKDNSRQLFDPDKIKHGIIRACEKRSITGETIDRIVKNIENELNKNFVSEIETTKIGEMVMEELKKVDEVAYVRFASVYKDFKDIDSFVKELENIKTEKNNEI